MRKIDNFENVQASDGEFQRPGPGGYIVEIVDVVDVPKDYSTGKGDYLKISYDISFGDFRGYYIDLQNKFGGDWRASFIRSYKDKALGMFKHFINCVEESNPSYKWNWIEKTLVGKTVGVVLQEEEYEKNDGSVGVKLSVKEVKRADQIVKGDFKVPELKRLSVRTGSSFVEQPQHEQESGDLPF